MERIGTYLKIDLSRKSAVPHERAEVILQLIRLMDEDKTRIKYWLGRTREYTPGDIHGLIKQAKEGRNPPALFNWLLKNRKKLSTPRPLQAP